MKEFKYVITDPEGIHARPEGNLVKQTAGYHSTVKMAKGEKSAEARRFLGVMELVGKQARRLRSLLKVQMKIQQQQNWRHSSKRIYKSIRRIYKS